ncbi:MAG: DUF2079 domain-containing protein [Chloroflexi bacterium]|nr:DUF2079 domain-containing protein [Chloroflexota bacterium]
MMKSRAHYFALAVVWLMIFAYGVYFSALSVQRHRAFLTNASDLGQIDQALWNSLQGRPLEFTRRTGEQSIRLTDHVEPIFVPTALVFLLYDNVEALLILQSFVIALGALPVFWIARRRLETAATKTPSRPTATETQGKQPAGAGFVSWLLRIDSPVAPQVEFAAVLFAAMYLLFPSLEAANLAEFHAVTFVPVLVLFMYHYGALKKWGRFALFAFLTLMVKEEIALLVLTMSAWMVIRDWRLETGDWRLEIGDWRLEIGDWKSLPKRFFAYLKTAPRVPMLFVALSLVWFVLTVFVIIPSFNTLGRSPYTCRYYPVSEECPQVARGLFLQERLTYLFQLFASSGFVSLLDPVSLLLGAPLILANVISNYPAQYSGTFHYSAPVVPYFILAAIGGTAWLARQVRERGREGERERGREGENHSITPSLYLSLIALFIAFAYHIYAGYTPIARAYVFPEITAHNELFQRFANQIPREAKLATTPSLHPHLSHREVLYRYPAVNSPLTADAADYVLLDLNDSDRVNPREFRIAYDDLLQKQNFGVVDAVDGYVLLKRGAPQQDLPDAFFTPFRVQNAAPQYPVQIDFENKVRFLGYDVLSDQYGHAYLRTYWQRLRQLDQNYMLFPFIADENGEPAPDLNFQMTCLFWYPSAAWKKNDTVVCDTIPLEWGARVRLGVGVTQDFDWANLNARLKVTRVEPSTLRVVDETWVEVGDLAKVGGTYKNAQSGN